MKKTVLVMVAALFAVGLFLSSSVVKAEEDKGPAEITLNTAEGQKTGNISASCTPGADEM